ncbi:hypothetical protein GOODEAATRI_012462 [Goodea atripinnis]|uniref:Uncharacterized protein n=1 Tax=Goodea atripinnis TaxID=208336 RepID=A0ABV0N0S8_9TELE
MHVSCYVLVKARGASQRLGMLGDIIWAAKRLPDPDAHSPEPSQVLVLYVPTPHLSLSLGALNMNGPICPQTAVENLSAGAAFHI